MVISTTSAAPVAMALARSAMAEFPPASRSAMMPEPTTAISRKAVPSASAASRRARSIGMLTRPDFVETLFQRHAVQAFHRQGGEEFDPPVQDEMGRLESAPDGPS